MDYQVNSSTNGNFEETHNRPEENEEFPSLSTTLGLTPTLLTERDSWTRGPSSIRIILPTMENMIRVFNFGLMMCSNRKDKLSQIKEILNSREGPCTLSTVEDFEVKVDEYYTQLKELTLIWEDMAEKFEFLKNSAENELNKAPIQKRVHHSPLVRQKIYNDLLQDVLSVCRESVILCLMDKVAMGEFHKEIPDYKSDFTFFCNNRKKKLELLADFQVVQEELEIACTTNRARAESFSIEWQEQNPHLIQPDSAYIVLPLFPEFYNIPSELGQAPQPGSLNCESPILNSSQNNYIDPYENEELASYGAVQYQWNNRSRHSPRVAFTVADTGPHPDNTSTAQLTNPLLLPLNSKVAFAGVGTETDPANWLSEPSGSTTSSPNSRLDEEGSEQYPLLNTDQGSGYSVTPQKHHEIRSIHSQPNLMSPTVSSSTAYKSSFNGFAPPVWSNQYPRSSRSSQSPRVALAGVSSGLPSSSQIPRPNTSQQNQKGPESGNGGAKSLSGVRSTKNVLSSIGPGVIFGGVSNASTQPVWNTPCSRLNTSPKNPITAFRRITSGRYLTPWTSGIAYSGHPSSRVTYQTRTSSTPMVFPTNASKTQLSGRPVISQLDLLDHKLNEIGSRVDDFLANCGESKIINDMKK